MGIATPLSRLHAHALLKRPLEVSNLLRKPGFSIPIRKRNNRTRPDGQILLFGAGDGNRTHTTSLEGWDSSH